MKSFEEHIDFSSITDVCISFFNNGSFYSSCVFIADRLYLLLDLHIFLGLSNVCAESTLAGDLLVANGGSLSRTRAPAKNGLACFKSLFTALGADCCLAFTLTFSRLPLFLFFLDCSSGMVSCFGLMKSLSFYLLTTFFLLNTAWSSQLIWLTFLFRSLSNFLLSFSSELLVLANRMCFLLVTLCALCL